MCCWAVGKGTIIVEEGRGGRIWCKISAKDVARARAELYLKS